MTGTLGRNALIGHAVPLGNDVLPKLATKETSFVLDRLERTIIGKGAVRAGKEEFTLFTNIIWMMLLKL